MYFRLSNSKFARDLQNTQTQIKNPNTQKIENSDLSVCFFLGAYVCKGLWDWHTKQRYFHTNLVHSFEAVNYHTKKSKKTKQSAFHTDLVNWHTKK